MDNPCTIFPVRTPAQANAMTQNVGSTMNIIAMTKLRAQSGEVGDGIVAKVLWSDPLMVAVPAWHPLLKHKRISLDEVLRYPLVPCDPHACGSHARQIQRVLRRVKQEPVIAERMASWEPGTRRGISIG